jgi:hypothetical protein
MQLRFRNQGFGTIYVACAWYDESQCAGIGVNVGGWASGAWWSVAGGTTVHTDVHTDNRYFYFYAEQPGRLVWGGNYGPFGLTAGFETCAGLGPPFVGMQQVDTGWDFWLLNSYTVIMGGE